MKVFEIEVRRTLVHTFTVSARSSAEAAAKVGVDMATDPHVWSHSTTTEVGRIMRSPRVAQADGRLADELALEEGAPVESPEAETAPSPGAT